jgi:DNA-directed RNA polymerase I, II, and III subunit RPABC1
MSTYEDKVKIFKARKTMVEMLIDRGVLPADDPNIQLSMDEFVFMFNSGSPIDIVYKHQTTNVLYYVLFLTENKVMTKKDFLNNIDRVRSENEENVGSEGMNLIIIYDHNYINSTMRKELASGEQFSGIEFFVYREIQFNITKNKLVPQHIPITREESQTIIQEYNCTKAMLPRILVTDPVARYFGMKPGTVCRIVRNSKSIGEYATYRIVR